MYLYKYVAFIYAHMPYMYIYVYTCAYMCTHMRTPLGPGCLLSSPTQPLEVSLKVVGPHRALQASGTCCAQTTADAPPLKFCVRSSSKRHRHVFKRLCNWSIAGPSASSATMMPWSRDGC